MLKTDKDHDVIELGCEIERLSAGKHLAKHWAVTYEMVRVGHLPRRDTLMKIIASLPEEERPNILNKTNEILRKRGINEIALPKANDPTLNVLAARTKLHQILELRYPDDTHPDFLTADEYKDGLRRGFKQDILKRIFDDAKITDSFHKNVLTEINTRLLAKHQLQP